MFMKKTKKKEKEVFAPGKCFFKMFWIFIIFSVLGAYYEQILYYFQTWYTMGHPIWEVRRGVIYGPLNVVYGFGAVILILTLTKKEHSFWENFLYGALIGGGFEAVIGLLQRFFLGSSSWDYSWHILNFFGVTSVPIMLLWGLITAVALQFVWPLLSHLIEQVPVHFGNIFTTIMVVLVGIDILISWTALGRQTLRRHDVPPFTIVGRFYDHYYTDEYLAKFFTNMKEN